MPAFDKNSVLIDYAYTVNPIDVDEALLQPCPHCGHPGERKHRSVCISCKRRIPPTAARQGWDSKVHNAFAEVSPYVVRKEEIKDHKFNQLKKTWWEILREYRQFFAAVAFVAAVFYATPLVGTAILGHAQWQKITAEWAYLIAPSPSAHKTIAATGK